MSYLKGSTPPLLDNYAPQIIDAYIASRMEVAKVVNRRSKPEDEDDGTFYIISHC